MQKKLVLKFIFKLLLPSRELSLIVHPDKPTGSEKQFILLNKAYQALTDETAKLNYQKYGNPDGPQALQMGIGLPSWIVEEKNSVLVLGVYTLIFMVALPSAVYVWWSNTIKFSSEQVLLDTTKLYCHFIYKVIPVSYTHLTLPTKA